MSGIYIKGMEMPNSCMNCALYNWHGCKATNTIFSNWVNTAKRQSNCPLIAVPDNGRLIDADALKEEWRNGFHRKIVDALMEDAPTIIPAEEGE